MHKTKVFKEKSAEFPHLIAQIFQRQGELESIKATNEKDTFHERFSDMAWLAKFGLLPLLILWSAITEASFTTMTFFDTTNNVFVTALLTALIVIIIEATKLFAGFKFVRFFTLGWLKAGRSYIIYFLFLMPFVFISFGGSAYLSISALPQIAERLTRNTSVLPQTELSDKKTEINSRYDALIADENKRQDKAQATTWKGVTTQAAIALSNKIQATKSEYEKQRTKEIEQASVIYGSTLTRFESSIISRGKWLQGLGGLGEFFSFILIILLCVYESAVYAEFPDKSEGEIYEMENRPSASIHHLSPPPDQRREIGFVMPERTSEPLEPLIDEPVQTPLNDVKPASDVKTVVFDAKYAIQRVKQTYGRHLEYPSERAKAHQLKRFYEFKEKLERHGYDVFVKGEKVIVNEPN